MFITLPEDIYFCIYKIYFKTHVLSLIPLVNTSSWMWKCSHTKKLLCTERGAIQLGYSFNDSWSRLYLSSFLHSCNCSFLSKACNTCISNCLIIYK